MDHENRTPGWINTAHRLDRPKVDDRYRPEKHGVLEGTLIWQGEVRLPTTGEVFHEFVVRSVDGVVFGVPERAGLRQLRQAALGARVFIRPTEQITLKNGNKMWLFEVFTDRVQTPDAAANGGPL